MRDFDLIPAQAELEVGRMGKLRRAAEAAVAGVEVEPQRIEERANVGRRRGARRRGAAACARSAFSTSAFCAAISSRFSRHTSATRSHRSAKPGMP